MVLYDVTSSYYEGKTCPLARFGHDRDGKTGCPIIVYGMLTDADGRPVAVQVYPGNTGDPKTVPDQVEALTKRFGLAHVVLVDVHTPKANVQYTTLDRKPLKSVRNRHQTNTILNTSHEPKSTTVLELKYRSYEMFTIIQEFTEKYRGFRGSLFSIHPLSGCERLP